MKHNIKGIVLDGAAYKAVKPVSNATITTAAESADALAIVMGEYIEAKAALKSAEAGVSKIGTDAVAATKAEAVRLRDEATRRTDADAKYSDAVYDKAFEVAKIHVELNGVYAPLHQYATGEVGITAPVTYATPLGDREFAPEITAGNRAAVDSFKPVTRSAPNTAAIIVKPSAEIVALRGLVAARARYETACQALADALGVYADCHDALDAEVKTEAQSVEAAVAVQKERDAM